MKKLIVPVIASMAFATPTLAAEAGLVFGGGSTSSTSSAVAGSAGSSQSAIFGVTGQQSSAASNSKGYGQLLVNGNDMNASSDHTSQTTQQGTTASFGFAGSQNGNVAGAGGSSSASGGILGGWVFINP